MRIMIKGGVWKNTEDEILKAAVMKYGKNQWARISSLLVRKSAKQCKARWYEWLDPSIKKTEWTREEDEKLLHLAKLMPTQWRTIAPIVGRTPSQCLERYEKLLDAAYTRDENYEPGDDPRKLRPGEIDPNPESKPARPDPVDMDEDEKEMLSEARARLANTRGKKAKRKAREKQLEEARRLASLQKRRELKAAGIDARKRKRKRRGIDYNAEIPFEKKPPPGFYDVAAEDRPVEQPKFPTTIEELEGERRVDKEARMRKQDIARNKIAQRQDAPSAILQANKLNDPEAVRRRSKLNLPAPQISDHELEAISKIGMASDIMRSGELDEGSAASRVLLATYPQTPSQGMTPLRTPQRTPAGKQDAIMMEAENQRRLTLSQTPLLGGENPILHPSDFSGVTPKRKEIHTPNPLLTPSATPGSSGLTPRIGMTPSQDGSSFGMTPRGTPMRDELHINDDMEMLHIAKKQSPSFAKIPLPANEYKIAIPPIPEENEEPEEKVEEDMSDRIAREKAEEEERQNVLLRKRSKVLQRELPRPPLASLDLLKSSLLRADEDKSSFVPPTPIEQAENMIRKELVSLLEHDNVKYPLDEKAEKPKKGVKRKSISVPFIEDFEENTLKEADYLIKEEAGFLRQAMGHESESIEEFIEAHQTCLDDIMYFPDRKDYGLSSVASNREKLSSLQVEFENVKKKMDEDTKKATRLEGKIKVLTTGYQKRAADIWSQMEAVYKQMDTSGTELECFQALQKQEQLAASNRTNNLWEEVQKQKELERTLQLRYGDLLAQKEKIQQLMEEFRVQAEIAARNRVLEAAAAKAEEAAAKSRALDAANAEEAAAAAAVVVNEPSETADSVPLVDEDMIDATSLKEMPTPQLNGAVAVNEPSETAFSVALVDEDMIEASSLKETPTPQIDAAQENIDSSSNPGPVESNIDLVSATQENSNVGSNPDSIIPQMDATQENTNGLESNITNDVVSHDLEPVTEKESLAVKDDNLEPVTETESLADDKDHEVVNHDDVKPSDNENDIRDTVDVQEQATEAEV